MFSTDNIGVELRNIDSQILIDYYSVAIDVQKHIH